MDRLSGIEQSQRQIAPVFHPLEVRRVKEGDLRQRDRAFSHRFNAARKGLLPLFARSGGQVELSSSLLGLKRTAGAWLAMESFSKNLQPNGPKTPAPVAGAAGRKTHPPGNFPGS